MILQQRRANPACSASDRTKDASEVAAGILSRLNSIPESTIKRAAEADRQRLERAESVRRAEIAENRRRLVQLVGRRYAGATVENFIATTPEQQSVKRHVADYVDSLEDRVKTGSGLFLIGPPGTGKDHLVTAVLMAAVAKGINVHWTDGMALFSAARDNIDSNRTEAAWLHAYTKPTLLAISDPVPPVGEVKEGFQIATLFSIIDRRYRDMKPTLLTMNAASREEADNRTSANIIDRLADGAIVLRCSWESYRK